MVFQSIHTRLEKISRLAAIAGGLGIIFVSVMITIDVFLRKFFGMTLGGASEIAGMVFAVVTAIAYPYVLLDRANIRIDVLYNNTSTKLRAILDVAAMLAILYFATRLTSSAFELLQKSWNGATRSVGVINIPIWIPQSLWVFGFALFALTALFLSVYAVTCMFTGNWGHVSRIAGIPSIEETIEEETHIDELIEDASAGSSRNEEDR